MKFNKKEKNGSGKEEPRVWFSRLQKKPISRKTGIISLGIYIFLVLVLAITYPQILSRFSKAASNYYVSKTNCSDTYTGSETLPWCTIQKAANTIAPGDIVYIKAGTYNERVTIPTAKSGTATLNTKFIASGQVVVSQGFVVQASHTQLEGFEVTPGAALGDGEWVGQVEVSGDNNTVNNFKVHDTISGSAFMFRVGASGNQLSNFDINGVTRYGIALGDTYNAGSEATLVKNGKITNFKYWSGINVTGNNHLVENVEIFAPSGSNEFDGDGIRVNFSSGATIRKVTIHDLWELYNQNQHTDAIQMWTTVSKLVIEKSTLGSWEPAPAGSPTPAYTTKPDIGPNSSIMAATGSNMEFTVQNCLILGTGEPAENILDSSINTNGTNITMNLYNNTFWSARPKLNSVSLGKVYNNVIMWQNVFPANLGGINSDYNAYFWRYRDAAESPDFQVLLSSEGSHTLGKSYATRVPVTAFKQYDISATTDWGKNNNWAPTLNSPLKGAGIGPALDPDIPKDDFFGNPRSGNTTDIGAFVYQEPAVDPAPTPTPTPVSTDTTPPMVSYSSPQTGSTVSGIVSVLVNATDESGIEKVEYFVDGTLKGTQTAVGADGKYNYSWDSRNTSNGSHVLKTKAYDKAQNTSETTVSVNVSNQKVDATAPNVSFTKPTNFSTVSGVVTLAANATDNVGVTKVVFYANSSIVCVDSAAPFECSWDTKTVSNGSYTLKARAFDAIGNYKDVTISVNVKNRRKFLFW